MSNKITTTKVGFKVEDITFRNARRQSAIDSEIPRDIDGENTVSSIPVSLTPESVCSFLNSKAGNTMNMQEKKLYETMIEWITDYFELKKKVVALELRLEAKESGNNVKDDI